ncbi:aspartyl protease family protein [Novosphingobium colocasiae]|uniref:Peptidase A2A n=1 Tax=Novosphingobium colocasiae TaxID=1256513 RepID=A0A918PMD6_9SPHN|nr:aspartyl protease family protein [Novosphingobium colocasiae]GGZ15515.1 hypothetical protein GCM10011614_32970 [Novosphingobium colocasiae]
MGATTWLLAVLVANPLILGATTSSPGPHDSAPFVQPDAMTRVIADTDREERLTIPVMLEGKGPYRFMIDTGSQATVVSAALAGSLGLTAGPQVTVVGVAGRGPAATARLDSLTYAEREVNGLTVPVLEGRHIGADGILGTDCLQGQRVLFDFTRNVIAIGDAAREQGSNGFEIIVRARRKAGRLIITDALIDGVRTQVIVDSGASGTIGNRALQQAMTRRKAQTGGQVFSVTGEALPIDMGVARTFRIDKINLANLPIAFVDAPAFDELDLADRPAILLGIAEMRAFKRVAIDFSSRKVLFDLPG